MSPKKEAREGTVNAAGKTYCARSPRKREKRYQKQRGEKERDWGTRKYEGESRRTGIGVWCNRKAGPRRRGGTTYWESSRVKGTKGVCVGGEEAKGEGISDKVGDDV